MVTVNFKLQKNGSVQLPVYGPERFEAILERCAMKSRVDLGGFIAVRKNRVITGRDMIKDYDEIDVFPALSGG